MVCEIWSGRGSVVVVLLKISNYVHKAYGRVTPIAVLYVYVRFGRPYVRPTWPFREVFFFVSMCTEQFDDGKHEG
jgi:hypothetical protein